MPTVALGAALAIGLALGAMLVAVLAILPIRRRLDAATTRLEEGLERLERLVRRLDERPPPTPIARVEAPTEDLPPDPTPTPPSRRRRADPAEVRRLAQRGRHSVEIAQLLDADVGEIELMLRLDAARAESVSDRRPAPAAPRS